MIPVPTREQQFAFQALQQALTEEKAFIRIDFKRLNRYNSPFFNPWENLLPLIAIVLISFAIMFTDNLIIGLSVLVFLIFLYIILLPFILTPIMHARVLKRIVPRMEKFLVAWYYGGISLVLNADSSIVCKAPLGNWEAFVQEYFPDLILPDKRNEDDEVK